KKTCAKQARPVTIKDNCKSGTVSPSDKPNAAATVIGITTMFAKIKKNHCTPAIQFSVFIHFFIPIISIFLVFLSIVPYLIGSFHPLKALKSIGLSLYFSPNKCSLFCNIIERLLLYKVVMV